MSYCYALLFFLAVLPTVSFALRIDRVILSSNANPLYLEFWPYAAKAWNQLIGIKPTLALIGDETVKVDESLGDVIRFEPIVGIPTGLHAQLIRLLVPAYFPHEVCILSDIDQLPMSKSYFIDQISTLGDDKFVIYNDLCYGPDIQRFAMCYVAAQGRVFQDIFNIPDTASIAHILKTWASYNLGFDTDELLLYKYITQWTKYTTHCVKLGDTLGPWSNRRIQRYLWQYDPKKIQDKYYIDACLIRPYHEYKQELDKLAQLAGVIY